MTKEQLNMIVALLTAQQIATTHLSLLIAEQSGIPKEGIAESFRKTAERLAPNFKNRDIISKALQAIAEGIDSSTPADPAQVEEQIRSLLH